LVQRQERRVAVHQFLLAFAQGAIRFIALQLADVAAGVVTDARDQLDAVGELDQIIIGPGTERLALRRGIILDGEDEDGDVLRQRIIAQTPHQREAVQLRHDQVQQNDRGPQLMGQ
jgi:hypothetical protein